MNRRLELVIEKDRLELVMNRRLEYVDSIVYRIFSSHPPTIRPLFATGIQQKVQQMF